MTATISNTVTVGITLDNGGYDNSLVVEQDGAISPGFGVTALAVSGTGYATNEGVIKGGEGEFLLHYSTSIVSGDGVKVDGSTFENSGTVTGGTNGAGAYGGLGVAVLSGSFTNDGTVLGGSYGTGYTNGTLAGSTGASGISISAGSILNLGSVAGGAGANYGDRGAPGGSGIEISGGIVINEGSLSGGDGSGFWSAYSGGAGVILDGGLLSNSGTVRGGTGGTDRGSDAGSGGAGVVLEAGTFLNTGLVDGGGGGNGGAGAVITGGLLINNGAIFGQNGATSIKEFSGGNGVYLSNGTLETAGLVAAGYGGQIEPAGSILSPPGDAVQFGSLAATLAVDVGATFVGDVVGDSAVDDTLELVANTSVIGSLDLGGSFSGLQNIVFDNGGSWLLEGSSPELAGGEIISGFTNNDTLVISAFSVTSDSYVPGLGLELTIGTVTETVDITGSFSTSSFLVTNSAGGTNITIEVPICYLCGTRIATPAGEVQIETLSIGDTVITRFNGYSRIKWIGRQSFSARFIKNNRDQIPVCIHAGALGPNLPRRDLSISPGHSMLIGGSLILARNLVNGVTITQNDLPEEIQYYQLEFDTHDCVLAEGAWSEGFCDYAGLRNQFHNIAEFRALYPNHVAPIEHLMCAPRPEHGPSLAAALAPIAARAAACTTLGPLEGWIDEISPDGAITGWAQDSANPELPVLLEILLQGRRLSTILACDYRADLAAANIAQGRCAFTFDARNVPQKALPDISVSSVFTGESLRAADRCFIGGRTKVRDHARSSK